MTDDQQLLRQYTREGSEPAFNEMVARHVDLVYAVALRVVNGDRQLAQDVTQTVFIDLACKARGLPRDVVLPGWLHRDTCYRAASAIRKEQRRRSREKTAMEMRALDDNAEPPWELITPQLDEALNHLSAQDRDVIVLRFLKRQDLRALGAALGISEDAAQKRVSRALEKLRGVLSRRGIGLTAVVLTSVLTTEALTAAPAGLAVSVATASLVAAADSGTTFAILKIMAPTKLKAVGLGAMVMAGVATSLVIQNEAWAKLRAQDEAVAIRSDQVAELRSDNERLSKMASGMADPGANNELSELRQLRAEAEALRGQTKDLAQLREANSRLLQAPGEPKTPLQILESQRHRGSSAIGWVIAFEDYARHNHRQLPNSFAQAKPFRPKGIGELEGSPEDHYEILYHGSLDSVGDRQVLMFREKKLWRNVDGTLGRYEALTNNEMLTSYDSVPAGATDGDFSKWEKERLVPVSQ